MKPSAPIQADQVPARSGSSYPEPFRSRMGAGFEAGTVAVHKDGTPWPKG